MLSVRQQRVVLNDEVSGWQNLINGVPQGSVLEPTLFIIYVNDLEGNLLSKVAKFADNAKLGGKVICTEDCDIIQEDLNKLIDWSEKWLMSLIHTNVRLCILVIEIQILNTKCVIRSSIKSNKKRILV